MVAHHDAGRADAEPHRPEAEDHPAQPAAPGRARGAGGGTAAGRAGAGATGPWYAGGPWYPGLAVALRLLPGPGLPAQPRVDALVDLVADPLDEALGHGRVVPRPEFGVGGHGRGDLVPLVDVHAQHVMSQTARPGKEESGISSAGVCPPLAGVCAPCVTARERCRGGGPDHPHTVLDRSVFLLFSAARPATGVPRRRNWQTGGMTMTDPVTAAGAAGLVAGEPCVLLKQGEIFLKGRNRQQFERMLQANLRAAVRGTGVPAELVAARGGARAAGGARRPDPGGARGGGGPGGRAGRRRAGDRPRLPRAAGGQDARGGDRRGGRADRRGQRRVRGPVAAPRQAVPGHLRAAQRADRRGGQGRARAAGVAQAPGHGDLRRGRPAARCSCSPAGSPGRAGCRSG